MLFSIFFVVFNLVFTGIVVNNAVDTSKDYIREEMGAIVEYTVDFNSWRTSEEALTNEAPIVDYEVASQIAESDYVTEFYTTQNGMWNSETLTEYVNEAVVVVVKGKGGGGEDSTIEGTMFTVSAINTSAPIGFVSDIETLSDGSTFSETDLSNGNLVALISEELATENSLQVGDTFELNYLTFEVRGIYTTTSESKNTIYVPELTYTQNSEDGVFMEFVGNVYYILDSVDSIEAFKAENTDLLPSEFHVLDANEQEFEALAKPLDLVSIITNIITYVVFVAGTIIVIAIVTIFIRDRKFEIGLLVASGESKSKIVTQFIVEIIIIAIMGFLISVATSYFISGFVGNWIVDSGMLETTTNTGSIDQISSRFGFVDPYGSVTSADVAAEFNPSVGIVEMVRMFAISMLLVIISSSVPLIGILNYKPRKILQD